MLALLQMFGKLGKTQFQKLLLLYTEGQKKRDYDFVPYKYGAFSFSADADLKAMARHGQIIFEKSGVEKICTDDYVEQLNDGDRKLLNQLFSLHGEKRYADIIKYTYSKYPYYAIKSSIGSRFLTEHELAKVDSYKPTAQRTTLFTIGYEGKSLEEYLNVLLQNNVNLLVDVRNNPQSMKYGFGKTMLSYACKCVGITYLHIPQVGIASEQRQKLTTQKDYDRLFEKYRKNNLTHTVPYQQKILSLLEHHKRIALTCFEASVCQCHRKPLAEAITALEGWEYELKHL